MTKNTKMDDFFNLPHLDEVIQEEAEEAPQEIVVGEPQATTQQDGYQAALRILEANMATIAATDHAKSMDALYEETLQHSRDLMDLGFNTDPRSQRGIFEVANTMFKNVIDSKNSKRDAELKMLKIIQDQQKLQFEQMKWKAERGEATTPEAEEVKATIVEDRNELVRRAREQMKAATEAEAVESETE